MGPPAARRGAEGLYAATGGPRVEDVARIAVLRANAVGDLVLALPALAALRRTYPEARLTLLGGPWHAAFLNGRVSPVDEVVPVPRALLTYGPARGRAPEPAAAGTEEARHFIETLRARRFDIVLQLHGGGAQSNALVQALGPRVSAGLRAPDAPALDRNLPYRVPHPEVLRLLEAVALVGAHGHDIESHLDVTAGDRDEAARFLAAAGVADGEPLVVLQPSCVDPRRAWAPERFAAVADHFVERGARIVLNGTADEQPVIDAVRTAMRHPGALDACGRLSLGGLVGLLDRARLVVSNDTGTAHLARALAVPSVTVFWIGNALGYAPLSSARHAVALSWRLDCPRCGRRNIGWRCEHQDSFVDEVGVPDVLQRADELWAAFAPGADGRRA